MKWAHVIASAAVVMLVNCAGNDFKGGDAGRRKQEDAKPRASGGSDADEVDDTGTGKKNGKPDGDEDRNHNGKPDGTEDKDGNGKPDGTEDKNGNGIPDGDEDGGPVVGGEGGDGKVMVPVGTSRRLPSGDDEAGDGKGSKEDVPVKKCAVKDEDIATCDAATGRVTGKKPGTTTAIVTNEDGTKHAVEITVKDPDDVSTEALGKIKDLEAVENEGESAGSGKGKTGTQIVSKASINFEDIAISSGNSDKDYNDGSLCFDQAEAVFKVNPEKRTVKVIKDAKGIKARTFMGSCNKNKLIIKIKHSGGDVETVGPIDPTTEKTVKLDLSVGDEIDVELRVNGDKNNVFSTNGGPEEQVRVTAGFCQVEGNGC